MAEVEEEAPRTYHIVIHTCVSWFSYWLRTLIPIRVYLVEEYTLTLQKRMRHTTDACAP